MSSYSVGEFEHFGDGSGKGLIDFEPGFVIALNFILALSGIYMAGGGNLLDSVWFWAPALFVEIPIYLMKLFFANSYSLLTPVAFIGVLVYLKWLKGFIGEGVYLLMLAGAVLMGIPSL